MAGAIGSTGRDREMTQLEDGRAVVATGDDSRQLARRPRRELGSAVDGGIRDGGERGVQFVARPLVNGAGHV